MTDFKTGSIWSEPDIPHPRYRLQVSAYGYLVLDSGLASEVRVRLVGTDGEWEKQLTRQDRDEVQGLVKQIVERVPREEDVDAESLATFGPACRWCRYRPVCGTYLDTAPTAWCSDDLDHRLPYDTWGEIVRTTEETDELMRIHLEDAVGRLVCVFGVPKRLLPDSAPGAPVTLFGIRPVSWSGGSEHPQNFRIVSDRLEEAAHNAIVVTSTGTAPNQLR